MSKKTSKNLLILLMILCSFTISCSKEVSNNQTPISLQEQNTDQISKNLEYLCSDECGGRQSGTDGNKNAADYIASQFKEMSLATLDNAYHIPYKKNIESIGRINLELIDKGKPVHAFVYGKDYVEVHLDDADISLPLYNEPSNTDCIVLTDNIQNIAEYNKDVHTKMIIFKAPKKYSKPSEFYSKGCIPLIRVTVETYNMLQSNIGKIIHFSTDIDIQEKECNNIASVIEGENHNSALLISAHFDHIGSIGKAGDENYFIWRGALDNSSGVSTMLETARYLKKVYSNSKPPCDIIFCAFNEEEKLLTPRGSSYFLEYIKGKYTSVFDINLDCLGNSDSSSLYILVNETVESKEASEKIIDNLKAQNINVESYKEDFISDHKTFPHAVCFTTVPDLNKSYTHSLEDTPDKINTTFLSEIAEKLATCIENTISTISIDKMELPKTSSGNVSEDSSDMAMAPSDFEERFSCKLDFLDSNQATISIMSRIGMFEMTDPAKPRQEPNDISDIRYFQFNTLSMPPCTVSFTTYKTESTQEMQLYNREFAEYIANDKSKVQKIGKNNYCVIKTEDNSKLLETEFTDKDILIHVYIVSSSINDFNSSEEYQDFFEKHGLNKLIDGMVELFKERG